MALLTVTITQEHIDMATPRTRCQTFAPLALALCELTGVLWNVDFDSYYPCGFRQLEQKMPPEAYRWMEDYDHNNVVAPASFELEVPDTAFITARLPWAKIREFW